MPKQIEHLWLNLFGSPYHLAIKERESQGGGEVGRTGSMQEKESSKGHRSGEKSYVPFAKSWNTMSDLFHFDFRPPLLSSRFRESKAKAKLKTRIDIAPHDSCSYKEKQNVIPSLTRSFEACNSSGILVPPTQSSAPFSSSVIRCPNAKKKRKEKKLRQQFKEKTEERGKKHDRAQIIASSDLTDNGTTPLDTKTPTHRRKKEHKKEEEVRRG